MILLYENQRFEIAPRPHLAVDLMVANNGWTAYPVKAVSRRRRGPKARLYRVRRAAKLRHQVDGGNFLTPRSWAISNRRFLVHFATLLTTREGYDLQCLESTGDIGLKPA